MSQSDYLQHKKKAVILKEVSKLSPVLSPKEYNEYLGYSLDKQTGNTKTVYRKLIQSGYKRSFNIDMPHTNNCPNFPICKNTNTRANRIPMSTVFFDPKPSRPLPIKVTAKDISELPICLCY